MKYIKSLYTAIVVLLLTACQSEQWEGLEGGFIVSLGEDVTVSTKSTPAELGKPDPELFKLKIVKESNGNTLYDGNFTGKTIPASAGLYTLTATCGENPVLAIDAPYYKGEESGVEVTEGETTPVELKCSVANALTSVIYDEPEKFNDLYSSYGLKIAVSNLSVTIGPSQTYKSAYYQAGTIPVFQFVGTLKDNGQEVSTTLDDERLKDAATFAAGKHCKLTLKVKPTESGVILTVGKVEVETVSISETIPVEWLPAPKISATGFDESKTLTIYETGEAASATIDFTVSQPLQDISFTLNFEDENLKALNNDYLLSTMTDEEKIALTDAGISLPLIGSNAPKITFSEALTSQLLSKNEGVVNNQITINSVTANNRTNTDGAQTYTIAVHKPEFSVSVLPGNIWTKEFTAEEITVEEGKGNAETIQSRTIYQYSENNGETWKDFNDKQRQYFDSHPDNKKFLVRTIYRNIIESSPVEIELEAPTQLPNSGMEEWYEEDQSNNKNLWFPYTQGSEGYLWNTNNMSTTNYRGELYCSTSAVKQTTNKHSGTYAAWIRTVGHGIANTSVGSLWGINGSITGDHTIGELLYSNPFTVRPTKLMFYYSYTPNGDDAGIVELKIENQEQGTILYETSQVINSNNYALFELPINYTIQNVVATHLTIIFKSGSKHTDVIPAKVRGNGAEEHYGSELYIDDISLIYDK